MSYKFIDATGAGFNKHKLTKVAKNFTANEIAVLPTDTNYVLACKLGNKQTIERLRKIRNLQDNHNLSLLLADFTELGKYAVVDNFAFRLMKDISLGGYTFILPATKEVPNAFAHKKRKTIGVRIPASKTLQEFIKGIDEPLISCSLKPPASEEALNDLNDHHKWLAKVVDLTIDVGELSGGETTILDFDRQGGLNIVRQGIGPTDFIND